MNILAAAPAMEKLSIVDAGIVALLGYGVVFLGLVALMTVVILLGKAFVAADNRQKAAPAAAAAASEQPAAKTNATATAAPVAPGSAGGVKLYDVEPKTAAMIMAIVADKLGKPLNELRFISIKEVK
jgi:Na+-transporting methylmalonyl-CoA/oxaloacetate decarboxylase gamma subunit